MAGKEIQKEIGEAVTSAKNIEEVKTILLNVLKSARENGVERIGYVAGLITSEGPENIDKNVKRLIRYADDIRSKNNFPIFASTDVISDDLFTKLGMEKIAAADWEEFWRDILGSGYVTDIFMTPRWEISKGSISEHNNAKNFNLQIHYITGEI